VAGQAHPAQHSSRYLRSPCMENGQVNVPLSTWSPSNLGDIRSWARRPPCHAVWVSPVWLPEPLGVWAGLPSWPWPQTVRMCSQWAEVSTGYRRPPNWRSAQMVRCSPSADGAGASILLTLC